MASEVYIYGGAIITVILHIKLTDTLDLLQVQFVLQQLIRKDDNQ